MNGESHVPELAQSALIRPPMVYVKDTPAWEYKQLVHHLAKDQAPTEADLNALGADGWELAAAFAESPYVYLYFKRLAK